MVLSLWISGAYVTPSVSMVSMINLVGGLEHLDYFSIYWEMSSSQLTNSYFSEGLKRGNHQPVMVFDQQTSFRGPISWKSVNIPWISTPLWFPVFLVSTDRVIDLSCTAKSSDFCLIRSVNIRPRLSSCLVGFLTKMVN